MDLVLSSYGSMFATRERARALVRSAVPKKKAPLIEIDASGVSMSPSFAAELLTTLADRHQRLVLFGTSPRVAELIQSLATKLGLADRVEVHPPAVSAVG